jgi:predicted DNA-binding transcriptional regulator AlpA
MNNAEQNFNLTWAKHLQEMQTITVDEFIKLTNISRRTFYKNVRPTLPVIRLGPRKISIPVNAAKEWMKNRTQIITGDELEEEEFFEDDENF